MSTVKMSASWENVRRAENDAKRQKWRAWEECYRSSGRMVKESVCPVGIPLDCRQLPGKPLTGPVGKMKDISHRQQQENGNVCIYICDLKPPGPSRHVCRVQKVTIKMVSIPQGN